MAAKSEIMKQYRSLVKTIESFSDGQAFISENQTDSDSLTLINVTISPRDGMYRKGKFEFLIDLSDGYPDVNPPKIQSLTKVYHPNIDMIDEYSEGDICLNLLDELWTPELTLEDYVQGLLFMFYNPNVDDPLNPAFCGDESEEKLKYNVRVSMRGNEVEGTDYDNVLPDGYESDDGEMYEEEYDVKFPGTKSHNDDTSDGESDVDEETRNDMENEMKNSLNQDSDNGLTTILEEEDDGNEPGNTTAKVEEVCPTTTIDEATGQQEHRHINQEKLKFSTSANLTAIVSRILRFLRPRPFHEEDSSMVYRSRLGSIVIYSLAIVAFRVGFRILFRTPLVSVIR